jgi:stress response protein YsnF
MTTDANKSKKVVAAVHEALEIGKKVIDHGGYRLTKSIETREVPVDQVLADEHVDVERIKKNQVVSSEDPPSIRQEGDTTIVPVLEEVLVVERRLVIKEEIRITRRRAERREQRSVELKSEHIDIERLEPGSAGSES